MHVQIAATIAVLALTMVSNCGSFWSKSSHPFHKTQKESASMEPNDSEPSSRKPIFFVHFHKSGGSSVCSTMKKSDLKISNANGTRLMTRNCNAPFAGPKYNVTQYQQFQTCASLTPLTVDDKGRPFHRNNFVKTEVPFLDKMPCPGYRSFAVMRHPLTRIVSHMTFHKHNETMLRQWTVERMPNPPDSYMRGYPIINSMVIRQLLGRTRFRDLRPVDEDDLHRAKQLVDNFDAFVPLEHLHHPTVSQLLQNTVPEYYYALQKKNVTAKKQGKRYQPSDEFLEQMATENKFDILLYQYMLERLGIDLR
jgi:hypothetical protein